MTSFNPLDLWDQYVVQLVFGRALVFLYETIQDFGYPSWGLAIILFTVIVKTLTLPLTLKSLRSTRRMQKVQPELQALQKQYKNDKERLMQEQMALYKAHGVNPVAGCLPMLVQMPIWIALYSALFHLSQTNAEFARPFLWIPNLGLPEFTTDRFPQELPILAVLTGITQWITTRMAMQPSQDPQQQMMNQVMQYMPIMFVFFSLSAPAGLVLYWVTSNCYQMVQQYFVTGWGQLFKTPAMAVAGGGTANNASRRSVTSRKAPIVISTPLASEGDSKADSNGVLPEPGNTPSNSGRRRRNKRR